MSRASASRWESLPMELRALGVGGTLGLLIRETSRSEQVAEALARWVLTQIRPPGDDGANLAAGPTTALKKWKEVTHVGDVLRIEADAERWSMRCKADAQTDEPAPPLALARVSQPVDLELGPGNRSGDLDGLNAETATP